MKESEALNQSANVVNNNAGQDKEQMALQKEQLLSQLRYMPPVNTGNLIGRDLNSGSAEDKKIYTALNFTVDRPNNQADIFAFYLMAKKGMNLETALSITPESEGYTQYVREFKEFCQNHPVRDPDQPGVITDNHKQNINEWTDIMTESAKKISEYRFPDIDYADPAQVMEHNNVLGRLSSLYINYTQEFEKLLGDGRNAYAESHVGGKDKFIMAQKPVTGLAPFLSGLKTAYMPTAASDFDLSKYNRDPNRYTRELAENRTNFAAGFGKNIAGKTIGEIVSGSTPEADYEYIIPSMTILHPRPLFKDNEGVNYLMYGNKEVDKAAEENRSYFQDLARKNFNSNCIYLNTKTFIDTLAIQNRPSNDNANPEPVLKDQLKDLFANNDSPDKMLNAIRDGKKTLGQKLSVAFHKLLDTNNFNSYHNKLGMASKYDIFRIDGKTPEQLFGEKYEGIKNEADRELLIQAEIANAICNSDKTVVIEQNLIGKNNEIRKADPIVVAGNDKLDGATDAFFSSLKHLQNDLKDQLDALLSTQKDKEANITKNKTEGSKYYQPLVKALNDCYEASRFDSTAGKNDKSLETLMTNLKKLKDVSETYYRERDNIFSAKRTNGKIRKNVAGYLKGELPYVAEKLKELAADAGIKKISDMYDETMINQGLATAYNKYQKTLTIRGKKTGPDRLNNLSPDAYDYYQKSVRKDALRKELSAIVSNTKITDLNNGGMHLEYLDNIFETSRLIDYAKLAVKRQYNMKIRMADNKPAYSLDALENEISNENFSRKFTEKVKEIGTNPAFVRIVSESRSKSEFLEKWDAEVVKMNKAKEEELKNQKLKEQQKEKEQKNYLENRYNTAVEILNDGKKHQNNTIINAAAIVCAKNMQDEGMLKKGEKILDKAAELKNSKAFYRLMIDKKTSSPKPSPVIRGIISNPQRTVELMKEEQKKLNADLAPKPAKNFSK